MTVVVWLSFTPIAAASGRNQRRPVVGAHAFSRDLPRSLCGFVGRDRAGDPAPDSARRCTGCLRAIARAEARILEQTRHDVAASVARHGVFEDES